MIIPNKTLFLGYGLDWDEVVKNDKTPLHVHIFTYGLTICLVVVNVLEVFFTKSKNLWVGLTISWFAILLTYLSCYFVFRQIELDTKIWNMFYNPRGVSSIFWCISTLWLTSIGIISLFIIKKLFK